MIDERFYTRLGPVTIAALIDGSDVQTDGLDLSLEISDAAALQDSQAGGVTYYGGKAYRDNLESANSSACFTKPADRALVEEAGMIALVSDYPRAAFANAIAKLYHKKDFKPGQPLISEAATIDKSARIMPGAVIGAGVTIGASVKIGPNAVIYPGVVVGAGSTIDANSTVQCAVLGENCHIHSAACIGGDGFGVAETATGTQDIPHVGLVHLADNVSIGYGTMVDRGMLGDTIIKRGAKIDNLCQIAHNCSVGVNTMIAGHTGIAGSVVIGDNVVMGGRVGIADHLQIGSGARLAASALLMRDIPEGEVWAGFPAKPIRQYMREVATLAKLARPKKKS